MADSPRSYSPHAAAPAPPSIEAPSTVDYAAVRTSNGESPWRAAGVLLLLLVGLFLVTNPITPLWKWWVNPDLNPSLLEAQAWLRGETAMERRVPYTALYTDDKLYNVYPPLFVIASYAALLIGKLQGITPGEFYPPWYVALVAFPLPLTCFWAFREIVRRSEWAAVLTTYCLLGTSVFPVFVDSKEGSINAAQSIIVVNGLMLIAGDLLGRRRIWPAAIGLVICAWTRQMTVLYAGAILWVAWRSSVDRRRAMTLALAGITVAVGGLLAINLLRFGNPLETGYTYIYRGLESDYAGRRMEQHGLFSTAFLRDNLWYMHCEPPWYRTSRRWLQFDYDTSFGVGIWWSTPLLFALFAELIRRRRDSGAMMLFASTLLVSAGVSLYHTNSAPQVGYVRFSNDFLPVWLALLAPWCLRGERRAWVTLLCLAWSAWYFHMIV